MICMKIRFIFCKNYIFDTFLVRFPHILPEKIHFESIYASFKI